MNKPMIRAQVRIHHDEDPALYAVLSPLTGIARTRRIRQLVRAGVMAENGSEVTSSPRQAEKAALRSLMLQCWPSRSPQRVPRSPAIHLTTQTKRKVLLSTPEYRQNFLSSWIVFKTLYWGTVTTGIATLMSVVLFLGGVQLIGIGVLGEYIGRLVAETKQRLLFIVESTQGYQPKGFRSI